MLKDLPKFEDLTERDISSAVTLYRQSHIPVVIDHMLSKAIADQYSKFMSIEPKDFEAHRASLLKMEDLRGMIKLEKPPKPIQ